MSAKILVVDDDPALLFSLKAVLTHDGYQVVAVETGELALEHIAGEDFDLALIDLKLGGIGGMEVLKGLKERSPDTMAIILTAHASLETAVEALRQGAHDYLLKPCTTEDLRESVRTGLAKRQREGQLPLPGGVAAAGSAGSAGGPGSAAAGQPPAAATAAASEPGRFLQRGGVIVDLARHVTTVDGHLLELSPTEFALLAHLVKEAPRVVSAQDLLRVSQGYESEPWEAREIVRFHIYRIRQKAEAAAGRADIIRTVRGIGYALGDY
jgi:DNA-binding response OmpR family regulator